MRLETERDDAGTHEMNAGPRGRGPANRQRWMWIGAQQPPAC
ncbi:MAG: hypothetical protein RL689_285, partial [Planctomycetota bacterium]